MKKVVTLLIFNFSLGIATVIGFNRRLLGLSFDPNSGDLRFALSIAVAFLLVALFFFCNYSIITSKEKFNYTFTKLNTIDDCINALIKSKKTNMSFAKEIDIGVDQLFAFKRWTDSLDALLKQNDASQRYNYLNQTVNEAVSLFIANTKKFLNRLIVFDNPAYLSKNSSYDILPHRNYINGVLERNEKVLDECRKLLAAVSGIGDTREDNLDSIKLTTAAFYEVLEGAKTLEEDDTTPFGQSGHLRR